MELKTALIAGATGLVGNELLQQLLADDHYQKIITVGRRKLNLNHPKLEEIIVDFDDIKEKEALLMADDIYCCLGSTMKKAGSKENFYKVDHNYPIALATMALKNKAQKYFLVSAMGADPSSFFFYNKVKGEVEKNISMLGYESIYIFRPSLILGKRDEKRPGEGMAQALANPLSFLLVGPLKKYRPIEASIIAKGMLKVAKSDRKGVFIFKSEEIKKL